MSDAPFSQAPTVSLSLDGVQSAPPAPSIASAQVALPNASGWQFSFNVVGGLEAEAGLVSGYRVYHSESNVAPVPPDGYYTAYPQPSTNSGQIVVQETTQDILFYWVSAYNSAGYESALTPVPFVYVDPGAQAPSVPAPVQTTKTFVPKVNLNGWGANAHAGNYEGGSGLGSEVWGTNGATTLAYSNPSYAFDGNQSTAASISESHTHQYAGCIWDFSSFPGLASGASVVSSTVSIVSEILPTSGPVAGHADIWYSLDGGSTWSKLYAGYATRLKQTDTITLAANQDITKVQIMAFMDSHDDIAHKVYEISLAVTQSAPAGAEKVTGVKATLSNGDVQITWNSLIPTSRTDILNYEVTRVVHGGGYPQSKVQTTVNWSGAASYSWTDVEAHDGTFDYYVIANNSTGASQPSDVANLGSADALIYATGETIQSLKPAQAGADVTGANTSLNTANVADITAANAQTLAQLAATHPSEMLANGNCQSGGGWDLNNGAHYDNSVAYTGVQSVNLTGAAWMHQVCNAEFINGHIYLVTAWVKTNATTQASGGQMGVYFESVDNPRVTLLSSNYPTAGNPVTGCFFPNNTPAMGWTQLQFTVKATATKTMGISFAAAYGATFAGTAWVGSVSCIDLTAQNQASSLAYSTGTTVEALMPAQAGADVTANNAVTLLQNPDFISGDVGWTKQAPWSINTIASINYPQSPSGMSSYLGIFSSPSTPSTSAILNNKKTPCSAGTVVTASCYAIGSTGATCSSNGVRLNFYDINGNYQLTAQGNTVPSNIGYAKSRVVATAPNNCGYVQIDFAIYDGVTGSGVWAVSGFTASILPNNLDDVPNGQSNFSVAAIDQNRRAIIDFGQGGHVNKTLDYISPGASGTHAIQKYAVTNGGSSVWMLFGTWTFGAPGSLTLTYHGGNGYNTNAGQQASTTITVRSGNYTQAPNISGVSYYTYGGTDPILGVVANAANGSTSPSNNAWDIWINWNAYIDGHVEVALSPNDTFTYNGGIDTGSGPSGPTTVNGVGGRVFNLGGTGLDAVNDGFSRYAAAEANANVTKNHVLTVKVTGNTSTPIANNGSPTAIPGLAWTAQASGAADVYNISGEVYLSDFSGGTGGVVSIVIGVDGNTATNYGSGSIGVPPSSVQAVPCVFFGNITDLSPGTHTIQVYATTSGTGISSGACFAICQRIF